tara:strand:- start:11849 stop:12082 length:234 start_codon:yes stop_codon:yes gene_type:complete
MISLTNEERELAEHVLADRKPFDLGETTTVFFCNADRDSRVFDCGPAKVDTCPSDYGIEFISVRSGCSLVWQPYRRV